MKNDFSYMTPMNTEYETCKRTYADYRIYGDDLNPDFITQNLGISPSSTQKKGEMRKGYRGCQRQIRIGGWFLSSEGHVQSKDVRHHLNWLFAQLMPAKGRILALQEHKNIRMGVNCVWWSAFGDGGPTLWPQQMSLFAELNLECSFDLAFFDSDDGKQRP